MMLPPSSRNGAFGRLEGAENRGGCGVCAVSEFVGNFVDNSVKFSGRN
jgi:hypothetical protein